MGNFSIYHSLLRLVPQLNSILTFTQPMLFVRSNVVRCVTFRIAFLCTAWFVVLLCCSCLGRVFVFISPRLVGLAFPHHHKLQHLRQCSTFAIADEHSVDAQTTTFPPPSTSTSNGSSHTFTFPFKLGLQASRTYTRVEFSDTVVRSE